MISTLQNKLFWWERESSSRNGEKDIEVEALLDGDLIRKQQELIDSLWRDSRSLLIWFGTLGMIKKQENEGPYELKPRKDKLHFFHIAPMLIKKLEKK